jgi:hypothetical protein
VRNIEGQQSRYNMNMTEGNKAGVWDLFVAAL